MEICTRYKAEFEWLEGEYHEECELNESFIAGFGDQTGEYYHEHGEVKWEDDLEKAYGEMDEMHVEFSKMINDLNEEHGGYVEDVCNEIRSIWERSVMRRDLD